MQVGTQPQGLPAPDQRAGGYASVVIATGTEPEAAFHTAWGVKFGPPAVQSIWDLIHKYDAGAW